MRKWIILVVLVVLAFGAAAQGETVYFLVGEIYPWYYDCYVLPLENTSNIAHARDLIEYGPGIGGSIVVGYVFRSWAGPININRNYLEPGIPAWSWNVWFVFFADLTVETCDGWPGWVEDSPGYWPDGSEICFWGYTVVAELGTDIDPWFCNLDAYAYIDFHDFAMFAEHWGESGCCHRYWCGGADLDGNGTVNMIDVAIFAENWLWETGL